MKYFILTDSGNQIVNALEIPLGDPIPTGTIEITSRQYAILKNNCSKSYEYVNGGVRESRIAAVKQIIDTAKKQANVTCRHQIISEFKSNVLGSEHLYKNTIEDQINLADLFFGSNDAEIRCASIEDKGNFINVLHTTEQIAQLYKDMRKHKFLCLATLDRIKSELDGLEQNSGTVKVIKDRAEAILITQQQ